MQHITQDWSSVSSSEGSDHYFLCYTCCYSLPFSFSLQCGGPPGVKIAAKVGLKIFLERRRNSRAPKKEQEPENHALKSASRALLYVTCVSCVARSSCYLMLSLPKSSLGNYKAMSVLLHSTTHTHTTQAETNEHHQWITLILLLFFSVLWQKIFLLFFFFLAGAAFPVSFIW